MAGHLFDRVGRGDQLLGVGGVDAIGAGVTPRGRRDAHVDLGRARVAEHAGDLAAGCAPHDRVIDHDDPLSLDHRSHRVVLDLGAEIANPLVGLDLVKTELISGIVVSKGKVTVTVDLPETNQFANNIRQEIIEKIEPLWDVEEVEVIFAG